MLDQALLLVRQVPWDVYEELHVLITLAAALQSRNTVSFHADLGVVLCSGGNLDSFHGAIDGRNVDGGAQRSLGKGNRLFDVQIVTLAGKDRMGLDLDVQIEISRRSTLETGPLLFRPAAASCRRRFPAESSH